MCKLFDDWKDEIKDYCEKNGLDFETAKNLPQAWNKSTVVLYYCEPQNDDSGLINDIPSPMVLLIQKEKDESFVFEQTEYMCKYLGMVSW